MRTTLTLDDDVAARVRSLMRRTGRSLKTTVNDLLRLGLESARAPKPRRPFVVRARPLGLRPGMSYDNIAELLELTEGPAHR